MSQARSVPADPSVLVEPEPIEVEELSPTDSGTVQGEASSPNVSETAHGEDTPSRLAVSEVLESIPEPKRTELIHSVIASSWAGPLPPPEILDKYKNVISSLPERLVAQWEEEGGHRRSLDRADQSFFHDRVRYAQQTERQGLWLGFSVVVAVLLAGLLAMFWQQPWLAGTIVSLDLLGLAGLFVYGRKQVDGVRDQTPKGDGARAE